MNIEKQIKPYRQGHLDSLCGIYSALNAFRIACAKAGCGARVSWSDIFIGCLAKLEQRWQLKDLISGGLTLYQHKLCIIYARNYLSHNHKIQAEITWPLVGRKRANLAEEFQSLGKKLDEKCAAAILCYSSTSIAHWTAVTSVKSNRINLVDSSGGHFMRVDNFTFHESGTLDESMTYVVGPDDLAVIVVLQRPS